MLPRRVAQQVFINCPFDDGYAKTFDAIVFAMIDAGFVPRCALESSDGTVVRLVKIEALIRECRYGIHDISRTEFDDKTKLPRFNMPFELGLFLGCKHFGGPAHAQKSCLILDKTPYRFRKFLSDISGQDVSDHSASPKKAQRRVNEWLRSVSKRTEIPGPAATWERYQGFRKELPKLCATLEKDPAELLFVDKTALMLAWTKTRALGEGGDRTISVTPLR